MISVILIVRLMLAGVFVAAALAKLTDLAASRKAVIDFGLPGFLAEPVGLLLPLVELVIALLLLVPQSSLWGGIGALTMLGLFSIAIVFNLVQGRTPDCNCFGQLRSMPIGWKTLLRNGVFAACAGFILWKGTGIHDSSVLQTVMNWARSPLLPVLAICWVVVAFAVQGWLILHLLRQHGRLLVRIDNLEASLGTVEGSPVVTAQPLPAVGLPVGARAPSFELGSLSGIRMTLGDLVKASNSVLLLFMEPKCKPCNALLPEVARWAKEYKSELTIAVITRGSIDDIRGKLGAFELRNVLLQNGVEVSQKYLVQSTPSAVLINKEGLIASPMTVGPQSITRLVANGIAQVIQDSARTVQKNVASTLKIGQRAPSFTLPDLEGNVVGIDQLPESSMLLIFWNPSCGFCARMLPDLKAAEHRVDPRKILIISRGSVESNRAMQLESKIVLDRNFSVGTAFGVTGTPSAIWIDCKRNIASAAATGATNVLALTKAEPNGEFRKARASS